MIYDKEKKEIRFESQAEKKEFKAHMAEFGRMTGKSHPDDCPYCAARGWKTFPGTNFKAECEADSE